MSLLETPQSGSYRLVLSDPPWKFATRSQKGMGRSADNHYETMTLDDIKALPVADVCDPAGAVLLLWVTDPLLDVGLDVMRAWGFKYKTVGYYWTKRNKDGSRFMGQGFWTRGNPEQCLLGVRGKPPKRLDAGVRKWIDSPRREHSRKPDEARARTERLLGSIPRLEMFARQSAGGWDSWGNQTEKFDR